MHDESDLPAFCPRYHKAIELIGRRWTGAILRVLLSGERRFHEIHAAIPGLSDRMLAERLHELEAEHIVARRVLAGPPVGVEYGLTARGRELSPVICRVADWAEKWLPLPTAAEVTAPAEATASPAPAAPGLSGRDLPQPR